MVLAGAIISPIAPHLDATSASLILSHSHSISLSLVVGNINHVPILKRHGHCFPCTMLACAIVMGIKGGTEPGTDPPVFSLPGHPFSIRHLPVFLSYAIAALPCHDLRVYPQPCQRFFRRFNDLSRFSRNNSAFCVSQSKERSPLPPDSSPFFRFV